MIQNEYPEKLLELSEICKENYQIPAKVFANANVKRGLRNADGSGVVAGATNLGLVHGYVLYEGENVPMRANYTIAATTWNSSLTAMSRRIATALRNVRLSFYSAHCRPRNS